MACFCMHNENYVYLYVLVYCLLHLILMVTGKTSEMLFIELVEQSKSTRRTKIGTSIPKLKYCILH